MTGEAPNPVVPPAPIGSAAPAQPVVESETEPKLSAGLPLTKQEVADLLHNLRKDEQKALQAIRRTRKKVDAEIKELQTQCAEVEQQIQAGKNRVDALDKILSQAVGYRDDAGKCLSEVNGAHETAKDLAEKSKAIRAKLDHLEEQADSIDAKANTAGERCKHINDGFTYVTETRPKVEEAAQTVIAAVGETEGLLDTAKQREGRLQQLEQTATDVASSIRKSAAKTNSLIETLDAAESRVREYEASLESLETRNTELADRVESLLPGAASAGLAEAFNKRANTFWLPSMAWSIGSILAIIALVAFSFWFLQTEEMPTDLSSVAWHLATRLPVAGALVWLAVTMGNRGGAAKRVGEDYASKAALAQSFEGYKAQLQGIDPEDGRPSPLIQHCENVLHNLSLLPGRLYNHDPKSETPPGIVADVVKKTIANTKVTVDTHGVSASLHDTTGTKNGDD